MCNCGQKRAIARQRQAAPAAVAPRAASRSVSRSPPNSRQVPAGQRQGVRARTITPPRRN